MGKLKVLVAEDDPVLQRLYIAALPEAVFDLKLASDGEEALQLYAEWKPEILLLDFTMPNVNGYQVLKVIREEKGDKALTIIMVTGQKEKESIVACAELGLQGYIVKPFKKAELAKTVAAIHTKRQKEKPPIAAESKG